jgi:hypothetical protein
MPIFDKQQLISATQPNTVDQTRELQNPELTEEQPTRPEFLETLSAAFVEGNTISNITALSQRPDDFGEEDLTFDALSDENLQGYEDYADAFIGAKNRAEHDWIKQQINREIDTRDVLARSSSWARVPSMLAAGIVDPLMMIPLARVAQVSSRGKAIAEGVVTGAAFGATAGLSREAILQKAQLTRDGQESLQNVLAETAIGAVLGGGFAAMARSTQTVSKQILSDALGGQDNYRVVLGPDGSIAGVERSVGAKETTFAADLEKEALAKINKDFAKAVSGFGIKELQSPVVRGLTSNSGVIRQLTSNFYDHNMILLKEVADEAGETVGRQQSAQLLMERDKAQIIRNSTAVKELYKKHTGVGLVRSAVRTPEGKLRWNEFQERISRVLRDETVQDAVPEVNAAAKIYRAQLDDWAKKLQEVGALPENLKLTTARNYLTRVYNVEKLAIPSVRREFIAKLGENFHRFDKEGNLRHFADNAAKEEARLEALDAAEETYLKIMRQGDDAATFNQMSEDLVSGARHFDKARTLNISDEILEPYLVNDASQLVSHYVNRASGVVRTNEAIRNLPQGYESFNDLKRAVNEDFNKQIAAATTEASAKKLIKEQAEASELLDQMYQSMTGSLFKSGKATKYFERLRQYQYMRLLGGVTLSSLPELAMPALRMGLLNTLRDGYLPMLRSWKTAKLTRDQFKDLDVGLEREMNNVLEALSDNSVSLGRQQTAYDRAMGLASDAFGKASGLTYFTSFGRRLGAHVASADLIRQMKRRGTLSATEKQRLATGGISTKDYDAIAAQMDKYSENVKGSWVANHELWDDEAAKTLYMDYIQRQVNGIVLKPGRGDIPFIFQKSDIGRLMFQFKSFASGATGRITIAGIQARDARTLMGFTYLTALGSLSGIVKDRIAGREISDDPAELVLDGVSRSGLPGLMGTVMLDTGLTAYNSKSRRFGGKNFAGNVLGPSVGQIQDVGDLFLNRMVDGKVTDNDIKAGLRMVPFNNLFYLQTLTNQAFGAK